MKDDNEDYTLFFFYITFLPCNLTRELPGSILFAFILRPPGSVMSRRRTGRACNPYNSSRTRCDGNLPWVALGRPCQYQRKFKKRGRKAAVNHPSPLPAGAHCDLEVPSPPYLRSIHPTSFGPAREETSTDGVPAFSGLLSMGHGLADSHEPVSMNSLEATFATYQANIPRTFDLPHPESGATALTPIPRFLTLALTSPDATATSASSTSLPAGCRFPCLEPLLPRLRSVMSPGEACSLLEIFFTEPAAVLDPIQPRPTSPALLATMLWCAAHTAYGRLYYIPGSRARFVDHLYCLVMSLLQRLDPENWHRVNDPDRARRTFGTGPTPTVDDVLTFVFLTIVISGGEYKSDCLKWWNKTLRLIRYLGFHKDPLRTGQPEPRSLQRLDGFTADTLPSRTYGPPTVISGTGLFEYFLPLMSILGDIIELHHAVVSAIATALTNCHHCISEWICDVDRTANASRPSSAAPRSEMTMQISYVLSIDPELSFMAYLVGIYLFRGSLVLLLFAERMPLVGPNPSVEEACESFSIGAAALSCAWKVNTELRALRQDILSMYQWRSGVPGLCL
ncbi:hypothetical protein BDQ94DRAFT_163532 [Aspergillus welwitschiae]|uniref:Transcription factor domain-containing protein n=1 Tax=Aspergillus welwitschiae TaxID=1341132 RepID=A0A3F3PL20_9EURO|nr:hypothetical protein BDQ94DRAFT_163532 [Aspergillus welwitschiae]RDH27548.1 hypothetical protein BDQ94DRAFT_163532 [Aspergillus welwitschiae]